VIWHTVRIDFSDVADGQRETLEGRLRGLVALPSVAWLRLERDLEVAEVTGLITIHRTAADLAAYRVDPDHVPVVEAIRLSGTTISRFDIETDDDVADLPA